MSANQTMINMNQLTANLIRLEKAESFLTYRWPLGLRPNLETQIKLLRRQLPPQTIAIYNQLKERGSAAVAEVVEGFCQGCHQPVASSVRQQIAISETTACCPSCGRFLYEAEDETEGSDALPVRSKKINRSRW